MARQPSHSRLLIPAQKAPGNFSAQLNAIELIELEIDQRIDRSGDGTTGVTVINKLSTNNCSSQPNVYDTTAGLLLSTNNALSTNSPTARQLGASLLLNADGDAGFSIPTGESFGAARINSDTGASPSPLHSILQQPIPKPIPATPLHTKTPAEQFAFILDVDGYLTGNPTTLTAKLSPTPKSLFGLISMAAIPQVC